ncbi:hypothetical protein L6452_14510 [Arctium lappa]|uniref:Uncharacterized protein n=1 Tax=Arctium lappa TaxID=4217 RepID=A0ACB9CL87_ARCLA|nr:hypothetical protein L6452_14510 [Arctium lappa]
MVDGVSEVGSGRKHKTTTGGGDETNQNRDFNPRFLNAIGVVGCEQSSQIELQIGVAGCELSSQIEPQSVLLNDPNSTGESNDAPTYGRLDIDGLRTIVWLDELE